MQHDFHVNKEFIFNFNKLVVQDQLVKAFLKRPSGLALTWSLRKLCFLSGQWQKHICTFAQHAIIIMSLLQLNQLLQHPVF